MLAGFGDTPDAALADAAAYGIPTRGLTTHQASPALMAFFSGGVAAPSGWEIKNNIAILSNE